MIIKIAILIYSKTPKIQSVQIAHNSLRDSYYIKEAGGD